MNKKIRQVRNKRPTPKVTFSKGIDETQPIFIHDFEYQFSRPYIRKKSVLDIGCWTGNYEYFLRKETSFIVALDIEEEALQVARRSFPTINFICASALALPLPKHRFDVVTMWVLLEHLPVNTELVALKEISRVLKKGGILFLSTMNDHPLSKILDPAYYLRGHRHYKLGKLSDLLKSSGFTIQEIRYTGGVLTPLYFITLYFFKHILHRKLPYWPFLARLLQKDYQAPGFNEINIRAVKN